jgi:hypothetical protein
VASSAASRIRRSSYGTVPSHGIDRREFRPSCRPLCQTRSASDRARLPPCQATLKGCPTDIKLPERRWRVTKCINSRAVLARPECVQMCQILPRKPGVPNAAAALGWKPGLGTAASAAVQSSNEAEPRGLLGLHSSV